MYEHQTNLVESKAEHMVALKMAQDDHTLQEHELVKDKKQLKKTEKEMELFHINEVRTLKLVSPSRNFFEILHIMFIILFFLF